MQNVSGIPSGYFLLSEKTESRRTTLISGGIIVIIMNNQSSRLTFGFAVDNARKKGIKVLVQLRLHHLLQNSNTSELLVIKSEF